MTTRLIRTLTPLLLLPGLASGVTLARDRCDLESVQSMTPGDAVIDSVKRVPAPVSHCEVVGHVITRDPGPNRVEFTVMLPDQRFLGRYYFVGEGAAAGFVPTTSNPAMMNNFYVNTTVQLLNQGFAVAGTDTGHKGWMWDYGIGNPAARLDYGHRGAHVSAVATQGITRNYYDMDSKLYRYHLGCSGGGRMGAMAALHHPEDYDGIVASTGFGRGNSMWFPWILQELIAHPDSWVPPAKLALLEQKVAEHCAGPDGLVRDPYACGFDPASLQCENGEADHCLTQAQVGMVKRITGRHPAAPGIDSGGFSLTNPTGWSSFLLGNTAPTGTDPDNPWAPAPPPSAYGIAQSILRGVYFDDAQFNFLTDLDFTNEEHLQVLEDHHADWGAVSTDLSAFKKAGGKLILWAGLGENAVPPLTEIEYYQALKKTVPGTDDFMRLYLVPGVLHCWGGPGPQDSPERFLDEVIDWVEQGNRPDEIVATATANPAQPPAPGKPPVLLPPVLSRTVLLCPYPQQAEFDAAPGAFPFDASNWTCN
jgi:tannase/feruloyl esterase